MTSAPPPVASGPANGGYPAFNETFRKATHNSYLTGRWGADMELKASGTYELLVDQALHEHVRAFEFDVMRDFDAPGKFKVRHSYNKISSAQELGALAGAIQGVVAFQPLALIINGSAASALLDRFSDENTQCKNLEDCLGRIRRLDYVLPDHEAVIIDLELKEFNLLGAARRTFDETHTMADLDGALWEAFGPRLYTPREFLARPGCAGLNLTECAKKGWPDINELRGRYLVVIHGNWGDNYWDWLDYASGDITRRAAFPMRGVLSTNSFSLPTEAGAKLHQCPAVKDPWVEINSEAFKWNNSRPNVPEVVCSSWYPPAITRARGNSIFWDVSDGRYADLPRFLQDKGVARCDSAFSTAQTGNQGDCVRGGHQIIPSDQPWSFIADNDRASRPIPLPTNPARALFDPIVAQSRRPRPAWEQLEPGHRLYLHLGGAQPNEGEASTIVPFARSPTIDFWEVQPSTTREKISPSQASDQGNNVPVADNPAVPGKGCLFARTPDFAAVITVCRETTHDDGGIDDLRRPDLTIWVQKRNQPAHKSRLQLPHNVLGEFGDLLGLQVTRTSDPRRISSTVLFQSAGQLGPSDQPIWTTTHIEEFPGEDLAVQGIFGSNDVLFAGLKHNGAYVSAAELTTAQPQRLVELSAEAYGTRRWLDNHSVAWNRNAYPFVGVHRAVGMREGQGRHLYTANAYELYTGGVTPEAENYFYLARDGDLPKVAPLYRCRVNHATLLTLDRTCGYPYPLSIRFFVEQLGYISTEPGPGLVPLYRLFHRATGDEFYTTDYAEGVNAANNLGYAGMAGIGYVWRSIDPPKRGAN